MLLKEVLLRIAIGNYMISPSVKEEAYTLIISHYLSGVALTNNKIELATKNLCKTCHKRRCFLIGNYRIRSFFLEISANSKDTFLCIVSPRNKLIRHIGLIKIMLVEINIKVGCDLNIKPFFLKHDGKSNQLALCSASTQAICK